MVLASATVQNGAALAQLRRGAGTERYDGKSSCGELPVRSTSSPASLPNDGTLGLQRT